MKQPNYDSETGVHYGVIDANELNPYFLDEICDGRDLRYEEALAEYLKSEGTTEDDEEAVQYFSDTYLGSGKYLYEKDGYKILFDQDDGYVMETR